MQLSLLTLVVDLALKYTANGIFLARIYAMMHILYP